jgi:transcriptional regulator with XRE-family HTH domain
MPTKEAAPPAPSTSDINARIADRIRALRSAQGLTLDELAERSGVSRAMISRVERGESSPTAVLLERLSTGLRTTLASLFDAPAALATSPLLRRADQVSWRDPQSGYVRRNLSPSGIGSPLRLVEVTFPAGARVTYEAPPEGAARIDQQVWVLTGVIEIGVGSEKYRLETGDCLAMQLDAPVFFRNPTRKPAHYLVAVTTGSA